MHNCEICKSEKKHSGRNMINPAGGLMRIICLLICGFLCFSVSHTVYARDGYTPVDAVIVFKCTDVEQVENNQYQITIRNENSAAPLPDNDTVNINDSGEGSFKIRITEPGTYDYLVYQIKGDDENVNYDNTIYEVHVFVVSNEDNELQYSVAVNIADTDRKPETVEFKNMAANRVPDTENDTEEKTEKLTEGTTELTTETQQTLTEGTTEDKVNNTSAKTGDAADISAAVIMMIASLLMTVSVGAARSVKKRTNK